MLPGDSKEMNERIRQLAGQALDQVVPYTWTRLDYDEIQRLQEYFAELIVKECMSNLYLNGYDDAMIQVQRHFGVEE
jgi:hypothetical protein